MLTVELGILNDCEIISFHNSYDTFPEEKFDALLVSIFKIEVYQSFCYYSTKCAWPCKYMYTSYRARDGWSFPKWRTT